MQLNAEICEVVRDVLLYFLTRPAAADDLEGIARWRLMRQDVERTVAQTSEALRWLAEHEFLVEVHRVTGTPVFRLNPARAAAAEELLTARGSGSEGNE